MVIVGSIGVILSLVIPRLVTTTTDQVVERVIVSTPIPSPTITATIEAIASSPEATSTAASAMIGILPIIFITILLIGVFKMFMGGSD